MGNPGRLGLLPDQPGGERAARPPQRLPESRGPDRRGLLVDEIRIATGMYATTTVSRSSDHEIKYVLRPSRTSSLVAWLRARCQPDAEFPGYIVSSIYFDSRDWAFVGEKNESDYVKTKVRLRWYSNAVTEEPYGNAFFEVKRKVGSRREKLRMEVDRPASWLASAGLNDPRLHDAPRWLASMGATTSCPLFPTLEICYQRRRFRDPMSGCRVCVDYNMRSPRVNRRVVPRDPGRVRVSVLELKGPCTQFPPALQSAGRLGLRRASFSKYGASITGVLGCG